MNDGVPHPGNCICDHCILRRRAEVDARRDMARPDEASALVVIPIAKARKPRRGSVEALRRLGRRGW